MTLSPDPQLFRGFMRAVYLQRLSPDVGAAGQEEVAAFPDEGDLAARVVRGGTGSGCHDDLLRRPTVWSFRRGESVALVLHGDVGCWRDPRGRQVNRDRARDPAFAP